MSALLLFCLGLSGCRVLPGDHLDYPQSLPGIIEKAEHLVDTLDELRVVAGSQ